MQYYLILSDLPEFSAQFMEKIPEQKSAIDDMVKTGKVSFYAVTEDRKKLYICMLADSPGKVMEVLSEMPMREYFQPQIIPLLFQITPDLVHAFSLN